MNEIKITSEFRTPVAQFLVSLRFSQIEPQVLQSFNSLKEEEIDKLALYRDETNNTVLILAAFKGYSKLIVKLLEHGMDPNVRNNHGADVMNWALMLANEQIFEKLVEHGYNFIFNDTRNLMNEILLGYGEMDSKFRISKTLFTHMTNTAPSEGFLREYERAMNIIHSIRQITPEWVEFENFLISLKEKQELNRKIVLPLSNLSNTKEQIIKI